MLSDDKFRGEDAAGVWLLAHWVSSCGLFEKLISEKITTEHRDFHISVKLIEGMEDLFSFFLFTQSYSFSVFNHPLELLYLLLANLIF